MEEWCGVECSGVECVVEWCGGGVGRRWSGKVEGGEEVRGWWRGNGKMWGEEEWWSGSGGERVRRVFGEGECWEQGCWRRVLLENRVLG